MKNQLTSILGSSLHEPISVKTQTPQKAAMDPLHSLRLYDVFEDTNISTDSELSFKFQAINQQWFATSVRETQKQEGSKERIKTRMKKDMGKRI